MNVHKLKKMPLQYSLRFNDTLYKTTALFAHCNRKQEGNLKVVERGKGCLIRGQLDHLMYLIL